MGRVWVINFGCRASQAEGSALKKQLIERGFMEGRSASESDLAVLNTCTVTAAADAEVRQMIRRLHRENPDCAILVTGCYAQRRPEEIAQLPGVRWVVGNSHKHRIADVVIPGLDVATECSPPPQPAISLPQKTDRAQGAPGHPAEIWVGEIGDEFHFAPVYADDRTRPTLRIQDGCNARCSFCVIPFIRGRSRSMAPDAVISQVRDLERAGFQEIVLSGINLGSYGRDLGAVTFLGLLRRILAETSIARLRISSIEPMDVNPELISLVAAEPRMAGHFHIPLQSGCDRILRLMNRRYWAAHYAELLLAIRERIPEAGIGADVMVGFPGETEQDHAESLRFIASLPFTYLHIFPYSARPGTRAIEIPNPVDGRRARARSQEMRELIQAKRRQFLSSQIGKILSVLTLHESLHGARLAVSSNYLKVALPQTNLAENVILDATAERFDGDVLFCRQAV